MKYKKVVVLSKPAKNTIKFKKTKEELWGEQIVPQKVVVEKEILQQSEIAEQEKLPIKIVREEQATKTKVSPPAATTQEITPLKSSLSEVVDKKQSIVENVTPILSQKEVLHEPKQDAVAPTKQNIVSSVSTQAPASSSVEPAMKAVIPEQSKLNHTDKSSDFANYILEHPYISSAFFGLGVFIVSEVTSKSNQTNTQATQAIAQIQKQASNDENLDKKEPQEQDEDSMLATNLTLINIEQGICNSVL